MKITDTIRDRFSTIGGSLLIHANYYAEGGFTLDKLALSLAESKNVPCIQHGSSTASSCRPGVSPTVVNARFVLDKVVEHVLNVMAHAQKPDLVFQRNGRVHLNRRGGVSSVDYWQPRCAHRR